MPEAAIDFDGDLRADEHYNQVIRHGGRRARTWGLAAANVQVHLIAMRCNLGLLAQVLARQDEERASA